MMRRYRHKTKKGRFDLDVEKRLLLSAPRFVEWRHRRVERMRRRFSKLFEKQTHKAG